MVEKKAPKWECRLCGARQSVTRVFGRSDRAADLRAHVQVRTAATRAPQRLRVRRRQRRAAQELNAARISGANVKAAAALDAAVAAAAAPSDDEEEGGEEYRAQPAAPRPSRWETFLPDEARASESGREAVCRTRDLTATPPAGWGG